MTEREEAIRKFVALGGTWPPKRNTTPPWLGSGRIAPNRSAECGHEGRPLATRCQLCGEALNAGD